MDTAQSAGLFVGIKGDFRRGASNVPYALDDAVDLAYEMSMGSSTPLLKPNRIVLALSAGLPQKPESKTKLKKLRDAGALRVGPSKKEILQQLMLQAQRVHRDGLLVVSFATHGVSTTDLQYLLTLDSDYQDFDTMIPTHVVFDTIWRSNAPRALIFIDACRENLVRDSRTGTPDRRSKAAFKRIMTGVEGQAVLFAAARGGYSYDADELRNGVFTAKVIEGLRCNAAKDRHHFITVQTLHTYVKREMARWFKDHGKKTRLKPTQLSFEGDADKLPLCICPPGRVTRTASAAPRP